MSRSYNYVGRIWFVGDSSDSHEECDDERHAWHSVEVLCAGTEVNYEVSEEIEEVV